MRAIYAATVVVSILAMLLFAPSARVAKAHGAGFAHSLSFPGHSRSARHAGSFRHWPLFGGLVGIPPDAFDSMMTYATPAVMFVQEPLHPLACHYSEQTVTVPSEDGGDRQITVIRC